MSVSLLQKAVYRKWPCLSELRKDSPKELERNQKVLPEILARVQYLIKIFGLDKIKAQTPLTNVTAFANNGNFEKFNSVFLNIQELNKNLACVRSVGSFGGISLEEWNKQLLSTTTTINQLLELQLNVSTSEAAANAYSSIYDCDMGGFTAEDSWATHDGIEEAKAVYEILFPPIDPNNPNFIMDDMCFCPELATRPPFHLWLASFSNTNICTSRLSLAINALV